jgi:hypothetical protein
VPKAIHVRKTLDEIPRVGMDSEIEKRMIGFDFIFKWFPKCTYVTLKAVRKEYMF